MNNPLVSIIIPVYNSERYLKECLDSVFKQSYSMLEVIVVNDGSTDDSRKIIESFTDDKRLKVIETGNFGVSHARNIGLGNVTGDYVSFIDSDDTVDFDYIELLLYDISETNADISICSYRKISEKETKCIGDSKKKIIMTHDEAIDNLLSGRFFMGGLCGKLYKATVIGVEKLDESLDINEDVLMNFALFDCSNKIVYHDICKYNYRENITSATHQINLIKMREQEFYASERILKKCKNKPYQIKATKKYAVTMLNWYQSYIMSSRKKTNIAEQIKEKLKNEKVYSLLSRRNEKIRYILFVYFPGLAKKIYRIYEQIRDDRYLDPIQGK